jgi:hypothetical protein
MKCNLTYTYKYNHDKYNVQVACRHPKELDFTVTQKFLEQAIMRRRISHFTTVSNQ